MIIPEKREKDKDKNASVFPPSMTEMNGNRLIVG